MSVSFIAMVAGYSCNTDMWLIVNINNKFPTICLTVLFNFNVFSCWAPMIKDKWCMPTQKNYILVKEEILYKGRDSQSAGTSYTSEGWV